jgi:hypothetical protein
MSMPFARPSSISVGAAEHMNPSFSYSEQYYKKDLLWVTNDTHGIGIVLLAADETIKMIESRR